MNYIKLGIIAAVLLAVFGAGWGTRDAFCDAAEARAELATEKSLHETTKRDLSAAKAAVLFANAAIGSIDHADTTRQETINERQTEPAQAGADRCKLGAAGVDWLRKVAPD